MDDIQEILNKLLDKWSQDTVVEILKAIDSQDIKWRGSLRRSVIYEIGQDGVEFLMADYGAFVDEGTGIFGPRKQRIPKRSLGGIAYHIKPWADSKNLNNWAVAAKIIQRGGIKARPFFKSIIEQRLATQQKEIQDGFQRYIEDRISQAANQ
jgi:hypothetical protein